ncbi:MAG: hypothetical protein WC346_09175 [Methanogenium sp.]|jgi:transcription elongation factor Elf1
MEDKLIKCPYCGNVLKISKEKLKEKYIQCPFPLCGQIFENNII